MSDDKKDEFGDTVRVLISQHVFYIACVIGTTYNVIEHSSIFGNYGPITIAIMALILVFYSFVTEIRYHFLQKRFNELKEINDRYKDDDYKYDDYEDSEEDSYEEKERK